MTIRSRMALAALGALLATAGAHAAETKSVAISLIVEVPQLVETKDGVLAGLDERGYKAGENLKVDYQNANGNMPTQQQIAKKFAGTRPDVIVAITTPTAQAMASGTNGIPIVFATVTDPLKARLIESFEKPGGNITGVSDESPFASQLDFFREIVPDMKSIGFIYNPGLDNSVSTLEKFRVLAAERDMEVLEAAAPTTNEVLIAARSLIGNVDAIYVPNDTTVVAALESVVKIGEDTDTPVFSGETRGVERGAIASIGLDYVEVGRLAGHMAADVLEGKAPADIPAVVAYQRLPNFKIAVNPRAAEAMGATLPDAVLSRATQIVE